jgi:hypothetical protein
MILSRGFENISNPPPDPAGGEEELDPSGEDIYQTPAVMSLGPVWQVTLGSSSSGNADANSHYYW